MTHRARLKIAAAATAVFLAATALTGVIAQTRHQWPVRTSSASSQPTWTWSEEND